MRSSCVLNCAYVIAHSERKSQKFHVVSRPLTPSLIAAHHQHPQAPLLSVLPFHIPHTMSKRQADTYLTKEPSRNRPDDDSENERDRVDPVQLASKDVMATR